MNRCKLCGEPLPKAPLLSLKNMPKSAQFFPDEKELSQESGMTLAVFECVFCGMVQADCAPVPYFREVIRASSVSPEMRAFRERQFAAFVDRFSLKGRKIVEIGAGAGEYLEIMQGAGVRAFGIEYGDESVAAANARGLVVQKDFVEDAAHRIAGVPFDAFYTLNFLEHIPEPKAFLRGIANNLGDGAPGIVEVPDADMILQKGLYSEFISDHLLYFRRDSLQVMLALSGFEVLSLESVFHGYILSAVVRKRTPASPDQMGALRSKINAALSEYIDKKQAAGKAVAVWGAGHQALAAIAQACIAKKLVFVVDSAPFKQEKYTPATHLRVCLPDILGKGEIGAVIVIAAGYSDEIATILAEKYPEIDVAILRETELEIVER